MQVNGGIISGEFDEQLNEFTLQQVKYFQTESIIRESQLTALYQYLKKHEKDADGQIITLYDQMPVRLSQEEIKLLLTDLEKVHSMYH
ncbi:hypothetical protein [Bacillus sp. MRMR6]|uniref:hypothetical protein n=1 Tax=Bacillus sp. MRMR6 TaxID=1928617 RepID=UPI0009511A6A|nr:hypothetical protein [Bacillus sp. MRMR6]OLS33962.1 hypothetical protein BTR25_23465 [Bacillus sp. MRMR6]